MDEGADWRGALHGIWQPYMKWNLCRLTNCAAEQKYCHEAYDVEIKAHKVEGMPHNIMDMCKYRIVVNRSENKEDHHYSETKPKVSKPVHNEGLLTGIRRRLLMVPETDEQV